MLKLPTAVTLSIIVWLVALPFSLYALLHFYGTIFTLDSGLDLGLLGVLAAVGLPHIWVVGVPLGLVLLARRHAAGVPVTKWATAAILLPLGFLAVLAVRDLNSIVAQDTVFAWPIATAWVLLVAAIVVSFLGFHRRRQAVTATMSAPSL